MATAGDQCLRRDSGLEGQLPDRRPVRRLLQVSSPLHWIRVQAADHIQVPTIWKRAL